MKKVLPHLIVGLMMLTSCSESNNDLPINSRLLGTKSSFMGEPTDPHSRKYEKLADEGKIVVDYENQFLIATTWHIINACGKRMTNLKTKNDTIQLMYYETAEELCMSQSIKEVVYFIDNPENKKWVFLNVNGK